jgi:hypothetical protein
MTDETFLSISYLGAQQRYGCPFCLLRAFYFLYAITPTKVIVKHNVGNFAAQI